MSRKNASHEQALDAHHQCPESHDRKISKGNHAESNAKPGGGTADLDVCLHCSTKTSDIQVRCDECSSFICSNCHWCHEFQGNHEIRVCDRCDAFYCRACDEMDQCDDCGEVVCASCSTLLSCKFCGGGLCEDCATACGRYVTVVNLARSVYYESLTRNVPLDVGSFCVAEIRNLPLNATRAN